MQRYRRVTLLELLQQAKDLRMEGIRTGNAQRQPTVQSAGDPFRLFERRIAQGEDLAGILIERLPRFR